MQRIDHIVLIRHIDHIAVIVLTVQVATAVMDHIHPVIVHTPPDLILPVQEVLLHPAVNIT